MPLEVRLSSELERDQARHHGKLSTHSTILIEVFGVVYVTSRSTIIPRSSAKWMARICGEILESQCPSIFFYIRTL
jgi:hypothetical protein